MTRAIARHPVLTGIVLLLPQILIFRAVTIPSYQLWSARDFLYHHRVAWNAVSMAWGAAIALLATLCRRRWNMPATPVYGLIPTLAVQTMLQFCLSPHLWPPGAGRWPDHGYSRWWLNVAASLSDWEAMNNGWLISGLLPLSAGLLAGAIVGNVIGNWQVRRGRWGEANRDPVVRERLSGLPGNILGWRKGGRGSARTRLAAGMATYPLGAMGVALAAEGAVMIAVGFFWLSQYKSPPVFGGPFPPQLVGAHIVLVLLVSATLPGVLVAIRRRAGMSGGKMMWAVPAVMVQAFVLGVATFEFCPPLYPYWIAAAAWSGRAFPEWYNSFFGGSSDVAMMALTLALLAGLLAALSIAAGLLWARRRLNSGKWETTVAVNEWR